MSQLPERPNQSYIRCWELEGELGEFTETLTDFSHKFYRVKNARAPSPLCRRCFEMQQFIETLKQYMKLTSEPQTVHKKKSNINTKCYHTDTYNKTIFRSFIFMLYEMKGMPAFFYECSTVLAGGS